MNDKISNICFIGNYLPRKCGIATFTHDLHLHVKKGLAELNENKNIFIAAINDIQNYYDYPSEVKFEINANNPLYYHRLREFLNYSNVEVVCLQHEFGIFGGEFGNNILLTLRDLKIPVVTTLHTVLEEYEPEQKKVFNELCGLSALLVVMSQKAMDILTRFHNIPVEKIRMIPHGIPDMPFVDPAFYKDQLKAENKKILLTFGLLSPGKGIENVIKAMPQIIKKFPNLIYIILGATHPNILRENGEEYRFKLQRLAEDLNADENIVFQNRFVSVEELETYLGASDIYVTPYLNKSQITSGTLVYAMGAGKAIISTPYWHAEELLAENRGRLVPFHDPKAIAESIIDLLSNEVETNAMRKNAYVYCRKMVWKEVAASYIQLFHEVIDNKIIASTGTIRNKITYSLKDLPEARLDHILAMTDGVALFQHARYTVPNLVEGYCLDDVSRGLVAATKYHRIYGGLDALGLIQKYLAFTNYARKPDGSFNNLMSYDKKWVDDKSDADDCYGRAIFGLGYVIAHAPLHYHAVAKELFDQYFHMFENINHLRGAAYCIIGLYYYLLKYTGVSDAKRYVEKLADRIITRYKESRDNDWRWFESAITYDNGIIPHALLLAFVIIGKEEYRETAVEAMEFLHTVQFNSGHYSLIGSEGWYSKGGIKAQFDQQPVDACALVEMNKSAYRILKDEKYLDRMKTAFDWFLGKNDLGQPLYDFTTCGCRDGLKPNGVNLNEGAESTLSFILSLLSTIEIFTRKQ
ncbi:MAG: glycosyltransferase [bacterium]|nr:glycosyltransferase [bacterium]